MEKGYPKVVWLFVFVCVQKGGLAAPEPASPAPPRTPSRIGRRRPRGRPAREHTRRARGRVPRGPLRAPRPPTLTPTCLDPRRGFSSIPFPTSVAFLSLFLPPHPFPSSFLRETRPPRSPTPASIRITVQ